jgi:hypothetical protein
MYRQANRRALASIPLTTGHVLFAERVRSFSSFFAFPLLLGSLLVAASVRIIVPIPTG